MAGVTGPGSVGPSGNVPGGSRKPSSSLPPADAKMRELARSSFDSRASIRYEPDALNTFDAGDNDWQAPLDPRIAELEGVALPEEQDQIASLQQNAHGIAGAFGSTGGESASRLSRTGGSVRSASQSDIVQAAIGPVPPVPKSMLAGLRAIFTALVQSLVDYLKTINNERLEMRREVISFAGAAFQNILKFIKAPEPQIGPVLTEMGKLYEALETAKR